ncbi:extracellular solute-binding protein [Microbacterium sp. NPDC096154]|uniref:ABC transporter substrate-binding protein n=1 Tax=Microbacterium sp. NPDC096154 TaxID=3155549 RepID=UPI00331F7E84
MRGNNTRRVGIVAGSVAAAALALTGCSASPAAEEKPELSDEPVTIGLTWWGGDARAEQTQAAIEAFQDEHPNITVEPQYADWAGYWDQLATTTAAGDMPDVVQMDELYLASYGARGALSDLDQLGFEAQNTEEDALATGQIDGVQYAAPIGVGVYTVFANADLFEKYGVELPDDESWTWDDYAAVSQELTDKSGGEITGSTLIGGWDAGSVKYWARSAGSELFGEGGEVTLDPQSLADMWQFQLDMIADGGMQDAAAIVESQAAGIAGGALATGKVALGVIGYNTQLTALTEASGADIRLLKLPEPEGVDPNFYKPSMFWSVASTSEHPAEAALLVDFLLNSETAADIIKTERGIPANSAIRDYLLSDLSETDQAAVEYQDRVTPGASPVVTPNGASGVEGILQRYTQEVFSGQTEPLAAAEAFVAELQGEIDAAQ